MQSKQSENSESSTMASTQTMDKSSQPVAWQQFLHDFTQHASEASDHTPESFQRGIVTLANRAHKLIAAAQPVLYQTRHQCADGTWTLWRECSFANYKATIGFSKRDETRILYAAAQPVEVQRVGLLPSDDSITSEQVDALDDLVTLVRRLVHALHKAAPQHDLTTQALDYLQRKGFDKGPLRSASNVLTHGIKPTGTGLGQES